MRRVNLGIRWGLGCASVFFLSGCIPWETAEDSGSVRNGDPNGQVEKPGNVSPRSDLPIVYVAATVENNASISSPENCGAVMGSGGNFKESSYTLKGKCNGGGLSPRIVYDPDQSHFLSFTISPEQSVAGIRDRAELAFVQRYFPFYEQLFIGFRLMIPEGTDVTEESFYALQLWQCAGLPPIAGVRVRRGSSHTIDFMTRGEQRGRSRTTFDLEPGKWHEFVLYMIPGPTKGALFYVIADSKLLVQSRVPYGFGAANACGENRNEHQYRVKFGIYKGGEPGKRFSINYDDLTIANRYESVAAPLGWSLERIPYAESNVAN
jgi:hypothetical protein